MVRAVVFDLDGTLIDSSRRAELCQRESGGSRREFWRCFLSPKYMYLDEPIWPTIELVKKYAGEGYRVIIVTGRIEERQKEETLRQLEEWGIPYDEIYFRKEGDLRKDWQFKTSILRELAKRYSIEAVYDDSEEVIEAVRREFPFIKAVRVDFRTHGFIIT